MDNSACITLRARGRSAALKVLASTWMLFGASAPARGSDAFSGDAKAADLTGLSLEELYNLDVVQPNVLGGHTHPSGESMFGYHYMHTYMSGLYDGSREITPAAAFAQGFGAVHINMEMDMHMLEAMYAPTERLTLMGMLSYMQMSMVHLRPDNKRFDQSTDGIGDLEAMALYTVWGDIRKGGHRVVLNIGASFPTGSINAKDHRGGDPSEPRDLLEYFMQHGSGSYEFHPGITYLGEAGRWSWGAQTIGTIHLGRNSHGYRLGNQNRASAWISHGLNDWLAPSVRIESNRWGDIKGSDPALAGNTTPEGRPDLRAGRRLDVLVGLNLYASEGRLKGNRLVVEGGWPIYQHLDGPQLGTSWIFKLSWSYAY